MLGRQCNMDFNIHSLLASTVVLGMLAVDLLLTLQSIDRVA